MTPLTEVWRNRLMWLTLEEAIILLRHLGQFEYDTIGVLAGGFRSFAAIAILNKMSATEFCVNVRPCWFRGGPTEEKLFKGTFLTMVLDRVVRTAYKKDGKFVGSIINYARCCAAKEPSEGYYSIRDAAAALDSV